MAKLKRLDDNELDYLNPTNDIYIDNYLQEIKRLDNELMDYLEKSFLPSPNVINHYEQEIQLKWDNLRFYKKYMNK